MNRRHLLAGAAALPVAGLVVPTAAADADPAVIAYRVWRDAGRAYGALLYLLDDWDDDDPEVLAMQDAERKARKALVETVATTPAGIACQVSVAFDLFRDQSSPDAEPDHPERYGFNGWANDIEGKLPRNMLAAAEQLA